MSHHEDSPSGERQALNIGPRTRIHMTLGTLYGAAGALLASAAFIWGLQAKVSTMAEDVAAIRSDLKPVVERTAILWDEHQRVARRAP